MRVRGLVRNLGSRSPRRLRTSSAHPPTAGHGAGRVLRRQPHPLAFYNREEALCWSSLIMPRARPISLPICTALVRCAILRPAFAPACRTGLLRGEHSDSGSVEPPRLMLLSSGLTTPELEANFRGMLRESAAGAEPCITMVVTAQMAPSNEADPPSECKPTSAGEKRRRRWYEARKKGRLLGAQLGVEVHCIDCAQTQGTDLEQELEGAHCIWVTGGNTFYLLQHMRSSGKHSKWMPSPWVPRLLLSSRYSHRKGLPPPSAPRARQADPRPSRRGRAVRGLLCWGDRGGALGGDGDVEGVG